MKNVLITYFTQTGNTEKIARAMYGALKDTASCSIKKLDQLTPGDIESCDYLFIGSPCHAGDIATPVREFFLGLPASPKFRAAAFITHASPAYRQDDFTRCIASVAALCGDKNIPLAKSFDCQGYLNPQIHGMVKQMKKFSDEDWNKNLAEMEGHPNEEDERNAAAFARGVLEQQG